MASIKDVAQKSGLSVTTVSRVLNDRGYISQEARQRVEDAMQALNYQPNELARSLYRKSTSILGLIVPATDAPFFGGIVQSVEGTASSLGYKVMLCNSNNLPQKEYEYVDMLKRNQVDGIIIASRTGNNQWFSDVQLPMISIDRNVNPRIPLVAADSYQGGILATEHLIAKGCHKLAHISGSPDLTLVANQRSEAFEAVCQQHGVDYVLHHTTERNLFELVSFREELLALFTESPDIDGFFASNDAMSAEVLQILRESGRRVPQDVKVVGYDDTYLTRLVWPSLTVIAQPVYELGRYAVDLLIRQIKGEMAPTRTMLPVRLIEREST